MVRQMLFRKDEGGSIKMDECPGPPYYTQEILDMILFFRTCLLDVECLPFPHHTIHPHLYVKTSKIRGPAFPWPHLVPNAMVP